MEYSKAYADVAAMIEKNWVVMSMSDFDALLLHLEVAEHITAAEHQSLFELQAAKYRDKSKSDPQ